MRTQFAFFMKMFFLILGICLLFGSCKKAEYRDSFMLWATETYLNFPIDEETQLPKFCLWAFKNEGKEYLAFPNREKEILFYDIDTGKLVKKVKYDVEGSNGVGPVCSFAVIDFNNIYIPNANKLIIHHTDTTGRVLANIEYEKTVEGKPLIPTNFYIPYPLFLWEDNLYISQYRNNRLGKECLTESPLGAMINRYTGKAVATPLKHSIPVDNIDDSRYITAAERVSVCSNGKDLVYSYELMDTVYKLSADFSKLESHLVKSRYMKKAKWEILRDVSIDQKLKRICELPVYGNLIYDEYRNVYYRFAFPEQEISEEKDYMNIYHNGRKQFSILILDQEFNVLGETLFPEYTYNAHLFFIREDGLYLSISHFKRSDFDDNVLSFQKIELVEL